MSERICTIDESRIRNIPKWLHFGDSIVRCCDCKNIGDDERVFGNEWTPVKICNRMYDKQGECLIVSYNDYCAWGIKRDE